MSDIGLISFKKILLAAMWKLESWEQEEKKIQDSDFRSIKPEALIIMTHNTSVYSYFNHYLQ